MGIKSLFAATIENKELPEPLEITWANYPLLSLFIRGALLVAILIRLVTYELGIYIVVMYVLFRFSSDGTFLQSVI
jgi:hypothetical protein